MPPKKKKKPDTLGQYRAGQRDSGFDIGGSGTGGGGGPVRGGGWLGKATRAYQKLWGVNQRRSGGGPKKPPGKKPPSGKPGTASNPNDSAARAKVRSRKSSARFDAKVRWRKDRRAADRKKTAQQATRSAVARRKAGIAAGQRASSAASPPPPKPAGTKKPRVKDRDRSEAARNKRDLERGWSGKRGSPRPGPNAVRRPDPRDRY